MVRPALLRDRRTGPVDTPPWLLRDRWWLQRRVELVTFDLDDCLWDSAEVMMRAEEARQRALADAYPRIAATWGWREFRTVVMAGLAETRPDIAHSPSELQKEGLRWCAREAGYDDDPEAVAALGFEAFAAARLQPTIFSGALEMLKSLRAAGYIVGTLSNGNADVANIAELCDCVDFSLTAEGVGAAKPDVSMFHAAMAAAGVTDPAACVHVGDDHGKDVLGAKNAGWRSIWCPASQAWEAAGPVVVEVPGEHVLGEADARIFELGQIVGVCTGWDSDSRPKL